MKNEYQEKWKCLVDNGYNLADNEQENRKNLLGLIFDQTGWTQEQLAERVGVSRDLIQRVSSGKLPVSDKLGESLRALGEEILKPAVAPEEVEKPMNADATAESKNQFIESGPIHGEKCDGCRGNILPVWVLKRRHAEIASLSGWPMNDLSYKTLDRETKYTDTLVFCSPCLGKFSREYETLKKLAIKQINRERAERDEWMRRDAKENFDYYSEQTARLGGECNLRDRVVRNTGNQEYTQYDEEFNVSRYAAVSDEHGYYHKLSDIEDIYDSSLQWGTIKFGFWTEHGEGEPAYLGETEEEAARVILEFLGI